MKRPRLWSPTSFIVIAMALIAGCMIYLVRSQISLRPATLIKPSVADEDLKNVAQAVVFRMFPELQSSHYLVWGIKSSDGKWSVSDERLFSLIKEEYERIFHLKVELVDNPEAASFENIQDCSKPCWLLTTKDNANELSRNELIEKKVRAQARVYNNLTLLSFDVGVRAPEHCLSEKRLSLECLTTLSQQAAEKKIKTPQRYFFLKKYNTKDFFLFVQETKKTPDR